MTEYLSTPKMEAAFPPERTYLTECNSQGNVMNQLDATYTKFIQRYFLKMFGHQYAHRQEINMVNGRYDVQH
jgi:hypothetical protein